MKSFLIITNFIFITLSCYSQNLNKSYSLLSNKDTTFQINVGGKLDANNMAVKVNTQGWLGDSYYYQNSFEPLNKIEISNIGETTINEGRIIFNNSKKWYSSDLLVEEIFTNNLNAKGKALNLWKTILYNHVYDDFPEYSGTWETFEVTKFLGIYGYSSCGAMSNTVSLLASTQTQDFFRIWNFAGNSHWISEIKINDSLMFIDADRGAFYLDYNNSTLASFQTIFNDVYLWNRTHIFGPSAKFGNQYYYSYFLNPGNSYSIAGLPESSLGPSLFFSLKPLERIIFSNSNIAMSDTTYHHLSSELDSKTLQIIRNGNFIFKYNNFIQSLVTVFDTITNVTQSVSSDVLLHSSLLNSSSYIIYKVNSPFVIVNANINTSVFNETINDSVSFCFSFDGINWINKFTANNQGNQNYYISFKNEINPLVNKAIYSYYIKIVFYPKNNVLGCGINDLEIKSTFQFSKFFMPSLNLGENTIAYSDSTIQENLRIDISWSENFDNNPPNKILEAIYPVDNSTINKSDIEFKWPFPSDVDNDEIVDFHFQLSDRSDFLYPLAPNFDRYISLTTIQIPPFNNLNNTFKSEFDGFFNSGQTYYWHVRSLDTRGAWSEWSPTFSFTPIIPMIPKNIKFFVDNNDTLLIWQNNSEGELPINFEIHASNQLNGFTPSSTTIEGNSSSNYYNISNQLLNCYRIFAYDSLSNRSPVSPFYSKNEIPKLSLPDTIIIYGKDSITLDVLMYISYYHYVEDLEINCINNNDTLIITKNNWIFVIKKNINDFYVSKTITFELKDSNSIVLKDINIILINNSLPEIFDFPDTIKVKANDFIRINLKDYIFDKETPFESLKINCPENSENWSFYYDTLTSYFYITSNCEYYNIQRNTLSVTDNNNEINTISFFTENISSSISAGCYPNPVSNHSFLWYILPEKADVEIQISDITGKLYFKQKFYTQNEGFNEIDFFTSNLLEGTYFCYIFADYKNKRYQTCIKFIHLK